MKILLVHGADFASVNQVNFWEKNKKGLGDFYHLSVFIDYELLLKKKGQVDLWFLEKQIQHAINLSRIDSAMLLLQQKDATLNLLRYFALKFPQISWNILAISGKNNLKRLSI